MPHSLVPMHLSLTDTPLAIRPSVLPEYERRLHAAFADQNGVSLLNRFKARKKNKKSGFNLPPAMASGHIDKIRLPSADSSLRDDAAPSIAIMSIEGPLLNKACWMSDWNGNPVLIIDGYDRIESVLSQLASDPQIKGIFVKGNTPGGYAIGCNELGRKVALFAKEKPILWYNEFMTCSAGYALATACTEIHSLETAITGSIGCVYARYDVTAAMEKAGVNLTIFKSDDNKAFGNPETELTEGESAFHVAEINLLAGMFRDLVSDTRGLSIDQIKDLKAGVCMGVEAQQKGLIDGFGDEAAAMSRLLELVENPNPNPIPAPAAPEPAAEPSAASPSTPKQENPMSKSIARHRASLAVMLMAAASSFAFASPAAASLDKDTLKRSLKTQTDEDVEAMDDEDVTAMDEDEDVEAMEEDEDLEAMDDDELDSTEAAMDDDEQEVDAKTAFHARATRIAKTALASVSSASAPAAKPTGNAVKDAVNADRKRAADINALPEAKGRESLAAHFASTDMSVSAAKAALNAAPKASKGKRLASVNSPDIGTGGGNPSKKSSAGDELIAAATALAAKK